MGLNVFSSSPSTFFLFSLAICLGLQKKLSPDRANHSPQCQSERHTTHSGDTSHPVEYLQKSTSVYIQ